LIRKSLALGWALLLAVCAVWLAVRLPTASIESSIFALLPERDEDPAVREAGGALRSELEKRFLVLVIHDDPAKAAQAAEAYAPPRT
jgi:predicted exporter